MFRDEPLDDTDPRSRKKSRPSEDFEPLEAEYRPRYRERAATKSRMTPLAGVLVAVVAILFAGIGYLAVSGKGGSIRGKPFTVAGAKVRPVEPYTSEYKVEVEVRFSAWRSVAPGDGYFAMVHSHYALRGAPREAKMIAVEKGDGSSGRFTGILSSGGMPETPCNVWIEQREGKEVTVVSNRIVMNE